MRLRSLFALLALFATCSLFAQPDDPLKADIESLKGKTVTLRHFYSDNDLHYATDGTLLGHSDVGLWTLTGRIRIEKVSVKEDHVQLEGSRVWVIFRDGVQVNGIAPILVSLRIDVVQGPDRVKKWGEALPRIFFTKGTPLSEDAPAYWKSYLSPPGAAPQSNPADGTKEKSRGEENNAGLAKNASSGNTSPYLNSPNTPVRVRVAQGVTEGMLIHKEIPQYPSQARAAHVQGQVVLHAIIGKDGHIKDLQVFSPAGAGLDDEAARAVQLWLYRPYYINGEPVEVDTKITVNFKLSE
jgi:TonB family protein